jgi:enoyl-CoA hydratase
VIVRHDDVMSAPISDAISYDLADNVATLTLDDGKANVLSPATLAGINAALDLAEKDAAAVVLTGRPGVFSGGFDLRVLTGGGAESVALLRAGFLLSQRLLSFPAPVVIACSGHAIAMGLFVVLSGDYRIGARGAYRLTANEVAIGMTLPQAAIEVCRERLSPRVLTRVTVLAEVFDPDAAVAAGLLDRAVEPDELLVSARETAVLLAGLNANAHRGTKALVRAPGLAALRKATDDDFPAA